MARILYQKHLPLTSTSSSSTLFIELLLSSLCQEFSTRRLSSRLLCHRQSFLKVFDRRIVSLKCHLNLTKSHPCFIICLVYLDGFFTVFLSFKILLELVLSNRPVDKVNRVRIIQFDSFCVLRHCSHKVSGSDNLIGLFLDGLSFRFVLSSSESLLSLGGGFSGWSSSIFAITTASWHFSSIRITAAARGIIMFLQFCFESSKNLFISSIVSFLIFFSALEVAFRLEIS
mmetsp:Transcript_12173/g.20170  ORF Transcript_12173/g.20170 Transcript_12173/m.20170 type:complete len:229 (-) Transcript_12173:383-1069(-)